MNIMHKLTIKNLLMNKTRTLVTLIGIMLSAALITLVACTALSVQYTLINYAAQRFGNYTVAFAGDFENSDLEQLRLNRHVENAYGVVAVGAAKYEYAKYENVPYVTVLGVSEGGFENCFNCTLKEGRYPQNTSEVVLSKNFLKNSTKQYNIGDTITLELGVRTVQDEYTGEIFNISHDAQHFHENGFTPKLTKTYTIVGVLDNVSDIIDSDSTGSLTYIYTTYDINKKEMVALDTSGIAYYPSILFTQFTVQSEQNYGQAIADIIGTDDAGLVQMYLRSYLTGVNEIEMNNLLSAKHIANFEVNYSILYVKLIEISLEDAFLVVATLVFIFGIIIISSIFIIRNSFYISITEKTKLYGMLASTGATPRQIRNNVFFEGFLLGLIAIPAGILFGVGATAGLVGLCNGMLGGILGGVKIQFAVSWLPIVMALILCIGTIFMSVLSPAIETGRVAPVVAIRGNQDIKISKRARKKKKTYKTPKLIQKLFGIGGSIAWKNLKRSKKKYRATVISITASVTVYLAASSIIGCLVSYIDSIYQDVIYNISVVSPIYIESKDELKKSLERFEKIADSDEVSECVYFNSLTSYIAPMLPKDKVVEGSLYENGEEETEEGYISPAMWIYIVDNETYAGIAESLGHTYDELKDKGIFYNVSEVTESIYDDDEGNFGGVQNVKKPVLKDMNGYVLPIQNMDAFYHEEEWTDWYNDFDMEKYGKILYIEIGAEITPENTDFLKHYYQLLNSELPGAICTTDWLYENMDNLQPSWDGAYYIISNDPDQTQTTIEDMGIANSYIYNYSKQAATINSVAFIIQFFVYSFIGIIAFIGLTNVFNTINTNMNLRKKEFAALRSIGMTNREFDRMITLESFFYTFKALIIGVPLGLVLGYAAYQVFNSISYGAVQYVFPWTALLLSIGVVALLIWLIMAFSIRKVRNRNIIETIRNNNI